jgi:hypothetical protein
MLIGAEVLLERTSNVEKDSTPDYFDECMQLRGADRARASMHTYVARQGLINLAA